jgi:aminoglycoside phosphotransferase family enzyme/predicted kinase
MAAGAYRELPACAQPASMCNLRGEERTTVDAIDESSLRQQLLRPGAFAAVAPAGEVALIETHISWVFLLDREVFKVKKPVSLGFLDFSSVDQRRRACEDEVRLNARLAPDVYRGVVPITRGADGRCAVAGTGTVVDWAVRMVRLSDEERADRLLATGRLTGEQVDRIACRVAAFHASAARGDAIAAHGRPVAVGANVDENFEQTRASIIEYLTQAESDEIVRWQTAFVRDQSGRFDDRIACGRVRDGHGDLRLEHVYLDPAGAIRVIDCIEFNDRFRYADVCADVAFLSMDLAAHGRIDLGERLLACYAREADDYDLYAVVDFYGSYRAFVRGKVASMLAHDAGAEEGVRQRAAEEARRFFRLALAFDRPSLFGPSVVAVGGVIASGKSSVATEVGLAMSAPVLEADRTRKAMLHVAPLEPLADPAWAGAYSQDVSERVYDELLRRAAVVLSSGRPVVLDASFRSEDFRRRARDLAVAHGATFRFVECKAPRAVCLERLARREQEPSVSDGRRAVFDAFCDRYEPAVATPAAEHIVIDTTQPLHATMQELRSQLDVWPSGLTR